MIDPTLRALADAPLADPLKINLPLGRSKAPRAVKLEYDDIGGEKLTAKQVKARKSSIAGERHRKLLDYYATTDVPVERIAAHLAMEVEHVVAAMGLRGRECSKHTPDRVAQADCVPFHASEVRRGQ